MQTASQPRLRTAPPWYAQRWPWLLMLGPAVVLVAGGYTGYLAYTRQDAMVVDDYYKQGKAINQDLRRDRVASAQRLSVALHYNAGAHAMQGELTSFGQPVTTPFRIGLAHSTLPEKDILLAVYPDAQGRFSAPLPALEQARWQVNVEGGKRDWRLAAEWQFPAQQSMTIDADAAIAP
ncbi:FixH family protein [Massilia sp. TWP1-3-3]|uniref:FixH family protein n=1 Tax=Massilia sp. TWP1-3-3 TaxID=2804573 RepID=UPI003CFA981E